jgi:protein-S-isoprenylcysteine O-methyltransferase Ste14
VLSIPAWVSYFGLMLFISGLLLFIIPLIQIGGVENISRLVTTGIYKRFRHPMYLGFIFWVFGYPLLMKAKLSLFMAVIWTANILYWRYLEEKELISKYDEYWEYKKRTIF